MNILFLCDEYPPGRHGGIGTAVQLQARAMAAKGHRVIVAGFYDWGYGGENEFDDNGVTVFRFRRALDSSWFFKKDAKRVRATYRLFKSLGIFQWDIERSMKRYKAFLEKLIDKYSISVVERPDFNEYVQYCTGPVYFPALSVPAIVKIHGTITFIQKEAGLEPKAMIFDMELRNLDSAYAISAVSKYAADRTMGYFKCTRPVRVLPNGVAILPLLKADKDPLKVVYVGSLIEKKGVYQLMKAWNDVIAAMPQARLVMLGKGHVEKVKAFLSQKALASVTFEGPVSRERVFSEVSTSAVAVFPSYAETFGLAAVEAMSYGTATIFTNRGAGAEIINDGVDGLIIDPDNVHDITQNILRLLNDDDLNKRLSTNGRKRVLEDFEIGKITDMNITFYEEVLARDR